MTPPDGEKTQKSVDNSKIHAKIFTILQRNTKKKQSKTHGARGDSESPRRDRLRATFVRPARAGRVLPIQSDQDAVTSAKQGGTASNRPCA